MERLEGQRCSWFARSAECPRMSGRPQPPGVRAQPGGHHLLSHTPYVLMADGLFTMTPGHTNLEAGELEERTKCKETE